MIALFPLELEPHSFPLPSPDITIFSDRDTRALAGKFLHVPLFIGVTPRESDIDQVAYEEVILRHHAPVLAELISDVDTLVGPVPHFCTSKIMTLSL